VKRAEAARRSVLDGERIAPRPEGQTLMRHRLRVTPATVHRRLDR